MEENEGGESRGEGKGMEPLSANILSEEASGIQHDHKPGGRAFTDELMPLTYPLTCVTV